jgi:hypothetical protein
LALAQAGPISGPSGLVLGEASHERCRAEVVLGLEEGCALDWANGLQMATGRSRDDGEPAGHGFDHR